MANKAKKTKSPATLHKTPAKKTEAVVIKAAAPSHEQIDLLARQLWMQRGAQEGNAEQDWLRAEQELLSVAS